MRFSWDPEKNRELQLEGRPSFEEALENIMANGVLLDGPNPARINQRILVVEIQGYPHVIPYEVRGDVFWLITIFPSRKYKNEKAKNQ